MEALSRRENKIAALFFLEGSRWLRLFWAKSSDSGLEHVSRVFCYVGFVSMIKCEDLGDQKPLAPIQDHGLFCACRV